MHILLASTNKGKVVEIKEVLKGLPYDIINLRDLAYIEDKPEEHGKTFAENALIKARFYHKQSGLPTLADDSGIIVEALKNDLGIHTRRFGAGPDASDQVWIEYFLKRMRQEKNKRARFICALAYIDKHGKEHLFEDECEGTITDMLEAKYLPGLPLSACFKPNGYSAVFSALSLEQKNSTSHRGKALFTFKNFLKQSE